MKIATTLDVARLLGEYTGLLEGMLNYAHLDLEVRERFKTKLIEARNVTISPYITHVASPSSVPFAFSGAKVYLEYLRNKLIDVNAHNQLDEIIKGITAFSKNFRLASNESLVFADKKDSYYLAMATLSNLAEQTDKSAQQVIFDTMRKLREIEPYLTNDK